MKNIILIGLPGCGKTTVGKMLAQKLGIEFTDSDKVFEETVCPQITQYFAKHSEEEFRREETAILKSLCEKTNMVIATGGGIVERPENKEILQNGGIVVFIDRDPHEIVKDIRVDTRPIVLAGGKQKVFELHDRRYAKYIDFCHIKANNIGSLEELTKNIINEVNSYNV